MKEMVGGCCVCSDERGWDENPLVYCDGQDCGVAVHQACYGIVSIPSGQLPWFCRKCESQSSGSINVKCELCPSRDGALKKADSGGWAHVVCALYIPEVRFANVTTMEPIQISLIPQERFNKTCYICEDYNRGGKASFGACMNCNKPGCKQSFHVTCAQMLGLLCEEAGNLMDNVKYCGYCQYHYSKLKKTSNMKIIPPFKPIANNKLSDSPNSSPEKTPSKQIGEKFGNSGTANPSVNVSPDMCDLSAGPSSKNSRGFSKKSYSSTSGNNKSSNSTNPSPVPRITPSNLFSSGAFSSSLNSNGSNSKGGEGTVEGAVGKPQEYIKTKGEGKEDSFKIEPLTGEKPSYLKKDMTSSLHDVVAAALDRPMTSTSKFELPTSSLGGGVEIGPSSGSSGRGNADKPPPDIKPHVTLTPIPMTRRASAEIQESIKLGKSTPPELQPESSVVTLEKISQAQKRSRIEVEEFEPAMEANSRETWRGHEVGEEGGMSPKVFKPNDSFLSLSGSRVVGHSSSSEKGTPIQPAEPWDAPKAAFNPFNSSSEDLKTFPGGAQLSDLTKPMKRGPGRPVKRRTGPGREDEVVIKEKKTGKGSRGGRSRGGGNSFAKREREVREAAMSSMGNGSFLEDSFDDSMDTNSNQSTSRGGRNSSLSRKNSSSALNGRKGSNSYDEPPTPTLSQLKAQMLAQKGQGEKVPAHMFGNLINPGSSMAQKLVDTLSQEMDSIASATGAAEPAMSQSPIVGVPFPGKSYSNGGSNTTSPSSTKSAAPPHTLEQLLERQWEQGSQFLMEQAQHLDIAQMLSCLHQLKQDNAALEDHCKSLVQRREQLTAINARLRNPLGSSSTLESLGPGFGTATAPTPAIAPHQPISGPPVNHHHQQVPGSAVRSLTAIPAGSPQTHHPGHESLVAQHQQRISNYSSSGVHMASSEFPGQRSSELVLSHGTGNSHHHNSVGPNHPQAHVHNQVHHQQSRSNSGYGHGSYHPAPVAVSVVTSHSSPHNYSSSSHQNHHHQMPREQR